MAARRSKTLTRIQNRVEYTLMMGFLWILRLLPWKLGKSVCEGLFLTVGYGLGIRRKVAETQLAKVYPDWDAQKRREVLKGLYRNMGLSIASIYLMKEERMLKSCEVVNPEHAEAAYALGRGVILATAHLGNWEAARVFPTKNMPVSVVVRRQRNLLFDRFNNATRARHGVGLIDMRRGLRDIIAEFHKNHMVAILMDQNAGKGGLVMDFLGFPASHWVGVAKLSLRYKVPILPAFALLTPEGGTRFTFEPMIYHPDWADDEALYPALLKEVNQVIERYIHLYPSQWFWVHKRWKGTGAMED